jgi:murein DD-endopeptidase MepM/ murein hydrolase activator NlpD
MAQPEMSRWPLGLCVLLAAIAPFACGQRGEAEPTGTRSDMVPAAATAAVPAPSAPKPSNSGPSIVHTVQEGETLWDIARAYGVSVDAILAASGKSQQDARRLSKGSELRIPGATHVIDVKANKAEAAQAEQSLPPLKDGAYHHIQRGESLWSIARSYDVPIDALLARNHLSDEDMGSLRIGQAIVVPGIHQSAVKAVEPKPHTGFSHEVMKGETVWDIAHHYRVAVSELMAANGLSADEVTNVRDGTRLFIPGVEDDGRGHVERRASAREQRGLGVARRLGLGTLQAAGELLHGHVEARWIQAAARSGRFLGTLRWPVTKGAFVRGYGSGQGGYHKAMDIMGKIGWNVHAAAAGIVGYAGDKVPGFGNMIMLVHPGGWVTLYAHNSVNFVAAGESVERGAILAEVGSTGRSQGPHVHFELIYGGNNCDPQLLFRPGVRHHNGRLASLPYTTWRDPNKRPRAIACAKRQKHPMAQSVESENPEVDATPEQGPETDTPAPEGE